MQNPYSQEYANQSPPIGVVPRALLTIVAVGLVLCIVVGSAVLARSVTVTRTPAPKAAPQASPGSEVALEAGPEANLEAAPIPQPAPPARIKVGVVVSLLTANQEMADNPNHERGWWHAGVARRLNDPQLELYAIVDPGAMDDYCNTQVAINNAFPPGQRSRRIEGNDAEGLSKLDVIVAIRFWNIHDSEVKAITRAVESGVSLLSAGSMGLRVPGYTPAINALNGYDDAEFLCPQDEVPVESLAARLLLPGEPAGPAANILGHLDGLQLKPIGVVGKPRPGTIPVLTLPPASERRVFPDGLPPGKSFYPIALAQLGKGRILSCNYPDPSKSLNATAGGNFHLNAIKYLAHSRPTASKPPEGT